jgi:hypothetical protein
MRHALSPKTSYRLPCKFFAEGRCVRGSTCKFDHSAPNDSSNGSSDSNVHQETGHYPPSLNSWGDGDVTNWGDAEPTWDAPSVPQVESREDAQRNGDTSDSIAQQEVGCDASLNSWGDVDTATPWDDPHTPRRVAQRLHTTRTAASWGDVTNPVEELGGDLEAEPASWHYSHSDQAQADSWVSNGDNPPRGASSYAIPPNIASSGELIMAAGTFCLS